MTSKSQTLRFLILSDTHGQDFFDNLEDEPHWMKGDMPKADVVLHCGDLTNRGSIPDNAAAISMLSAFNAELKLVIAGNHDISLDKDASTRPEMLQTHRKVINMWTGHAARAADIHYLTEGFHTFTLKNDTTFTIYASPYTPEFNNWAFGYPRSDNRFGPLRNSRNRAEGNPPPDIVMTHGPPHGFLDSAHGNHLGCPHLHDAVREARPRLHCFGHVHESAGAQRVDWKNKSSKTTLASCPSLESPLLLSLESGQDWYPNHTVMVNAAMVDSRNKPVWRSPWVIDMEVARK